MIMLSNRFRVKIDRLNQARARDERAVILPIARLELIRAQASEDTRRSHSMAARSLKTLTQRQTSGRKLLRKGMSEFAFNANRRWVVVAPSPHKSMFSIEFA